MSLATCATMTWMDRKFNARNFQSLPRQASGMYLDGIVLVFGNFNTTYVAALPRINSYIINKISQIDQLFTLCMLHNIYQ